MSGCVAFVKLGGLVEAELFPQIWEQIDHKYYERRLLVAESCGILVPHVQVSPAYRTTPTWSCDMYISARSERVTDTVSVAADVAE